MNAVARKDITFRMLDPYGDWEYPDHVAVKQGDEVTFVYDETSPTSFIVDISDTPGITWLWTVPFHWFEDFDDVPTWSEVVKLLHDNGLEFRAEFDSYGWKPAISLNFYPRHANHMTLDANDAANAFARQAIELMNRRWTGNTPIMGVKEWQVFVDALPPVYTTDVAALLGDLKTFFQENIGLLLLIKMVSPIEGVHAYNQGSELLRRLQEVAR